MTRQATRDDGVISSERSESRDLKRKKKSTMFQNQNGLDFETLTGSRGTVKQISKRDFGRSRPQEDI